MNRQGKLEVISLALNDTSVIRVHSSFKKYLKKIKDESKMSFPVITKRLAEDSPLVVVPIGRRRRK